MLKVEIAKKPTIYVPKYSKMAVRHDHGRVLLLADSKAIDLSTVVAHKIGFAMASAKLAPGEIIVLTINGERIELLQDTASQLAAGLLRKADDADDFQRRLNNVTRATG